MSCSPLPTQSQVVGLSCVFEGEQIFYLRIILNKVLRLYLCLQLMSGKISTSSDIFGDHKS